MPRPPPSTLGQVAELFQLMRSERVLLFKGLGYEVQMASDAQPDAIAKEFIRRAEQMNAEPEDVPPEQMPPEIAAPFMAFRPAKRPDFIPPPSAEAALEALDQAIAKRDSQDEPPPDDDGPVPN